MPNRDTHIVFGALGALFYELCNDNGLQGSDKHAHNLGLLLGGAFGGMLPDIFDPATSPNHRQFAHGVLPAAAIRALAKQAYHEAYAELLAWAQSAPLPSSGVAGTIGTSGLHRDLRFIIAGFFLGVPRGYISHLALDAFTPRGLPMLGKFGA